MDERPDGYIPAAGRDWLLPLYDPFLSLLGRDRALRRSLLHELLLEPGQRLLDVGCGTGTLLVALRERHPDVEGVGVDGDEKVLALARRKVERAGAKVQLDRALAGELPYPDGSFDRVVSSLVLHHLARDAKLAALAEMHRVLRPGGQVLIADFGRPTSGWGRALAGLVLRAEHLQDNLAGRIPEFLERAGFADVHEAGRHHFLGGVLVFHRGRKEP